MIWYEFEPTDPIKLNIVHSNAFDWYIEGQIAEVRIDAHALKIKAYLLAVC
jgi:hypothetical protein